MRITVSFIALIGLTTSWALKVTKEEPKDKREAAVGYGSPSQGYQSQGYQSQGYQSQGYQPQGYQSQGYQPQGYQSQGSQSQGYEAAQSYQPSQGYQSGGESYAAQPQSFGHDANAISIGAGYSVGGAKPSYSFGGLESAGVQLPQEGLQSSGHGSIQLAPITLQPSQNLGSNDLSELMNQLSQGLNSGALSLSSLQGEQGAHGGQEFAFPQLSGYSPKLQLAEQTVSSVPAYAVGTKGLGSYGSTGPVLFNPAAADSHASQAPVSYSPSSGHSLGQAVVSLGSSGHSYGGLSLGGSGHSLGGAGLSLASPGHSLGGAGYSFGGAGHSLGGAGLSLGGSGHSLGGSGHSLGGSGHSLGGPYKSLSGYSLSGGKHSFKPSAYLGSSQGDSSHGLSSLSGSYASPSYGKALSGGHGLSLSSGGHGASFGGSLGGYGGGAKLVSSYPGIKSGYASLESMAAHFASSPSFGPSHGSHGGTAAHAASSYTPHYASPSKYSFGEGSSSFRGPSTSHSSLSSYPPKYSLRSPSRHPSKDSAGAYSETVYNTIKYSEELKPRTH